MSAQAIRDRYKVPAALNLRIKVRGATGMIVGFEAARLRVMMDGALTETTIHPVLGVTYPAPGEVFAKEPKKFRGTHLSVVAEPDEAQESEAPEDTEVEEPPVLPDGDHRHGKPAGYRKGCRCEPCTVAWRQKCTRERQARFARELDPEDPRHGTTNFYSNYGCRCDKCTDAQSVADPRIGHNARGTRPHARRPRQQHAEGVLAGAGQQEMAS